MGTKRGRPSLTPGEASYQMGGLRLPARLYDRACQRASEQRVTVSEVIRRALRDELERENRQR